MLSVSVTCWLRLKDATRDRRNTVDDKVDKKLNWADKSFEGVFIGLWPCTITLEHKNSYVNVDILTCFQYRVFFYIRLQ